MLSEGGIIVESDGLAQRGFDRANTASMTEMVSAAVFPASHLLAHQLRQLGDTSRDLRASYFLMRLAALEPREGATSLGIVTRVFQPQSKTRLWHTGLGGRQTAGADSAKFSSRLFAARARPHPLGLILRLATGATLD